MGKIHSVNQVKILMDLDRGYSGQILKRGGPSGTAGAILVKGQNGFPVKIRHVRKLALKGYIKFERNQFFITEKGRAACVNYRA